MPQETKSHPVDIENQEHAEGVVHENLEGWIPTLATDRVITVLGLLLTTQEAVKHIGPEGGSILNVSSIAGQMPVPTASVYSATKAAVDAITVSLAGELGPRKIRVNSINPGLVETEGTHAIGFIGGEWQKEREAATPLGRIGRTSDIAPIAVFLASDDAGWVTGEIIIASGGLR